MQENLTTLLILEDFKYHQFASRLEALDVVLEYHPEFSSLVARMTGIPFGRIPDAWIETYDNYMEQALNQPYHDTEALLALARECAEALENI